MANQVRTAVQVLLWREDVTEQCLVFKFVTPHVIVNPFDAANPDPGTVIRACPCGGAYLELRDGSRHEYGIEARAEGRTVYMCPTLALLN